MPLIYLRDIAVNVGFPLLLDGIELSIEPNERVGLIGRNGEGKSTLLKIIQGIITPDRGTVEYSAGCTVATLPQEVPAGLQGSIYDVVASGLNDLGQLLARYHAITAQTDNHINLDELHELQHTIEAQNGWSLQQRIDSTLSRLSLDGDLNFADCSGGLKRRVLLARAFVQNPSLLLLDEPTNHLDIAAIEWLENALLQHKGALLFVTHDRAFLQKVATRIIEIDRGKLTSWPGNYQLYLERKAAALQAEEKLWSEFDKKLAQEEVWIRQGIKARRTRNEGRVRALEQMRFERKERRNRQGQVQLKINTGGTSGKQVLVAEHVDYAFANKVILKDFSITLGRGDKVGIIGPNGCGKTTLLRLLLGELQPQHGTIKYGTQLQINYFDQQRAQLDETKNAIENLAIGSDSVTVNGKTQHVMSYLQDFLFSPQRARMAVKQLSGGERNRLLLARLFLRPSNVLVMDEPTNDLDMETLDLLEEILMDYPGTLLLISHDRAFLNNIVTSTLVFEGDGVVTEYIGGYDDWQAQWQAKKDNVKTSASDTTSASSAKSPALNKKRNYKEQRELEQLPGQIEKLEQEQQELQNLTNDPTFYKKSADEMRDTLERLKAITDELEILYARWSELE
ncbi:MAG: ATP-binding cassette domain-containing protein [Gammaproteobacteria bacterium]